MTLDHNIIPMLSHRGLDVDALLVTKRDGEHTEGLVLCFRVGYEHDPWVVWKFDVRRVEGSPYVSTFWGFYTDDRDEALRNLFARAGFGAVEALA